MIDIHELQKEIDRGERLLDEFRVKSDGLSEQKLINAGCLVLAARSHIDSLKHILQIQKLIDEAKNERGDK